MVNLYESRYEYDGKKVAIIVFESAIYLAYGSVAETIKINMICSVGINKKQIYVRYGSYEFNIPVLESNKIELYKVLYNKCILDNFVPSKQVKSKTKKRELLHTPIKKWFLQDFYPLNVANVSYQFNVKDGTHLNNLIKSVRNNMQGDYDDIHVELLVKKYIEESWKLCNTDKNFTYLKDKFTIATLYSNFNALFTKIYKLTNVSLQDNERIKSTIESYIYGK